MPDLTPRHDPPEGWREAFAALPLEAPPADRWPQVARALQARAATARRRRPLLWLAAAATVACAALLPLRLQRQAPPAGEDAAPVAAVPRAAPDAASAASSRQPPAALAPGRAAAPVPVRADAATERLAAVPAARSAPGGDAGTEMPGPAAAASAGERAVAAAAPGNADAGALRELQAESARLEALIALARDERVMSARDAALSDALGARVGAIDAALSQPRLDAQARDALWRQRVSALRELAAIETTQRWLAARGERYDGALVAVD
ncbi:hypothetical protein EDC50_0103 [Vulcaniibacterium tengchongense]|uniref:Uncharacterized protein n=1 Tax=Vulcaniibacterium tengchongense TaxID=1273429 RepID=A0A3N4VD60_9GAMM|nr:hypothetical protein [Vulcaniibacterium tengchongense]RPE80936.1 hypothetical protein EDC50_0103 [Vulcaniibacterium tengchongense]